MIAPLHEQEPSEAGPRAGLEDGGDLDLGRELQQIVGHVTTLIRVRSERARWSVMRTAALIAGLAVTGIVVGTLGIAAALQLVRGLSGGLAEWSGRPWLGELGAGLILLAASLGATMLILGGFERRELRRKRRARETGE